MTFRRIDRFSFAPDWRLPSHQHAGYHEMILPLSGAIETQIAGQTLHGRAGCVMVYPSGVPHAERSVGRSPLRMLWVTFTGPWPAEAPLFRAMPDRRCEMLAGWMHEQSSDPDLREMLLQVLLRHYHHSGGDSEMIGRVRSYVSQHLADAMALDDLAAVAGLSAFHFARLFRTAVGVTPMKYVRQARIDAARALLLSPMPLRTIAAAVGFRDEFELSRVFKRETGVSPRYSRNG